MGAFSSFAVASRLIGWPTNTHCVGRFLVDLPEGSTIKSDYISQGSRVRTVHDISPTAFNELIETRQEELKSTLHDNGGTMHVQRDDISINHVTLISWGSKVSTRIYRYEEFRYIPQNQLLFIFDGKGTANAEARQKAAEIQRKYTDSIIYRAPFDIPVQPGFCICSGFIAGDALNREEMNVSFKLPTKKHSPSLILYIESYVTANEQHQLSPNRMPYLAGAKELRQGIRKWNGRSAVEDVWKVKENGRWVYVFSLHVPSKANDLQHPYLAIKLEEDELENPYLLEKEHQQIFSDDAEALAFWDKTISGLRLRPTRSHDM